VIVTDYDEDALRAAARAAGACGYALKQNLPDLARLIGTVLGDEDYPCG
jgi:DNA-binding NarL/FixJ family response regulator